MNSAVERQNRFDDEVSLVDLAATFVRRRHVFYIVFTVVLLVGVVYALMASERYEYVSLLKLAERSAGEFFEGPKTTLATLSNRWLPELQAAHRALNGEKIAFKVSFANPESTALVRISSDATNADSLIVEDKHSRLVEFVLARQNALVSMERESLQERLDAVDQVINSISGSNEDTSSLLSSYEKRTELEQRLADIRPAEALVVSRQSVDTVGASKVLIVALTVGLGLFLGVFCAFFVEFACKVRLATVSEKLL